MTSSMQKPQLPPWRTVKYARRRNGPRRKVYNPGVPPRASFLDRKTAIEIACCANVSACFAGEIFVARSRQNVFVFMTKKKGAKGAFPGCEYRRRDLSRA